MRLCSSTELWHIFIHIHKYIISIYCQFLLRGSLVVRKSNEVIMLNMPQMQTSRRVLLNLCIGSPSSSSALEVLLQHAAGWTEAHMGMSEGLSLKLRWHPQLPDCLTMGEECHSGKSMTFEYFSVQLDTQQKMTGTALVVLLSYPPRFQQWGCWRRGWVTEGVTCIPWLSPRAEFLRSIALITSQKG